MIGLGSDKNRSETNEQTKTLKMCCDDLCYQMEQTNKAEMSENPIFRHIKSY